MYVWGSIQWYIKLYRLIWNATEYNCPILMYCSQVDKAYDYILENAASSDPALLQVNLTVSDATS